MKKYILSAMLIPAALSAMKQEKVDDSVVPGAAYLVYEGTPKDVLGGVPAHSQYVTFYSADGDALKTVAHGSQWPAMARKLDPNAPKPKPVKYAVSYWPGVTVGSGKTKGVPGDFIIFYDKHDNKVASYRYDRITKSVLLSKDGQKKSCPIAALKTLDLSQAKEVEAEKK